MHLRRRDVLKAAPLACLGAGGPARAAARRSRYLAVDGARLYLLTRGAREDAPLLLWLHGGPGAAERPLFRLYNGGLERRFLVTYWDQRGAGRSFDPAANPATLTIARHLADLDAVVDHLRATFRRERVILVGHSWGSALGLLYAQRHPAKVAAFVGVSQVVTPAKADQSELDFVRDAARAHGDDRTLRTLRTLGAPPFDVDEADKIERLVDHYGGLYHRRPNQAWAVIEGLARGYVTLPEIPRIIEANRVSLRAMRTEIAGLDLARDALELAVPVMMMLGRYDRHVDSRLGAAYFEALRAPAKRLVWFDHSAHNPPFEEPEAFDAALEEGLSLLGAA